MKLNKVLLPLALCLHCFQSNAEDALRQLEVKMDAIATAMIEPSGPGCSVGIIQQGEFIFQKHYGLANVEHSVPISASTRFRMASVSKQFTAMAVLLLADNGLINLDDDIRKYIPDLYEYQHEVTINAMLGHFAGMGDYDTLNELLSEPLHSVSGKPFRLGDEDYLSNDEYYDLLKTLPLLTAPEKEQRYSNFAYNLLTLLVENVSDQTFRAFTTARIFTPLGMKHTFFADDKREVIPHRAYGYISTKNETSGKAKLEVNMTNLYVTGDGGLFTTLEDMRLWNNQFSNPILGKKPAEFIALMNTPNGDFPDRDEHKWYYANGQYTDGRYYFHNGGWLGTSTSFIRRPDTNTSVVAMCNSNSLDTNALTYPVFQILADLDLWHGEDPSVF